MSCTPPIVECTSCGADIGEWCAPYCPAEVDRELQWDDRPWWSLGTLLGVLGVCTLVVLVVLLWELLEAVVVVVVD